MEASTRHPLRIMKVAYHPPKLSQITWAPYQPRLYTRYRRVCYRCVRSPAAMGAASARQYRNPALRACQYRNPDLRALRHCEPCEGWYGVQAQHNKLVGNRSDA